MTAGVGEVVAPRAGGAGRSAARRSGRAHCPELDALTRHVRSFGAILIERQGERLPDWVDAVRQDDLPSLHTLAAFRSVARTCG
jgi:hypothetical protein